MSEEPISTEAEGSEIDPGQSEMDPELEYEQPDGEVEEGTEGEVEDEPNDPEIDEFFDELERRKMTPTALVKSYDHASKKITEQGQRIKALEEILLSQRIQTPQKPDAPVKDETGDDELLGQLLDKPEKTLKEIWEAYSEQMEGEKTAYAGFLDRTMGSAQAELGEDPEYGDLPDEAREVAQQIMEEPFIKNMFDSVNQKNFRGLEEAQVKEGFKYLLKLVHDASRGRVSKQTIQNERVKARRDAKKSYLKKSRAVHAKPSAKKKPAAKVAKSSGLKSRLRGIDITS